MVRPFHLVYADWRGVPILEEFLLHSPGLASRLTTFECGKGPPLSIRSLLETVAKHCPNLNNVVLSVRNWDTLTLVLPLSPLPKTTQRLGLRSYMYKRESKRSTMRALCNALCHATQDVPRLHVVRFMNRQTTRNLRVANRSYEGDDGQASHPPRGL